MDDKYWFLKNCPLFERLTPEQTARLEQASLAKNIAKGSLVYLPSDAGDSVFLLTSGRIKLYHITGDGKQAVLALIEPGEMFGELALFNAGQREEFAEAMAKSTLIKIPRESLQTLMHEEVDVAMGVTKLIGFRRQRVERRLKSLLFRSNRERLIHLLVELADKYGRQSPDGVHLGIKLSHQEMASIIGATRETVTVVLGELQHEGVLEIRRRTVILKQLERMAGSVQLPVPNIPRESPFLKHSRRPAEYGV